MANFNVVAIAASAGGLDALEQVVADLPRGLPAAVMIVLHTSPASGSAVPEILNGMGRIPASLAVDGERLSPGRIYVAPSDRHMIVEGDKIRLILGPKEHFTRPAADPLFRSIARNFGRRAIGIVLSGSGRDGAEGLAAIKGAGGATIVQEPKDATFASMPLSALAVRLPDHCVPVRVMAAVVERLVRPTGGDAAVAPRASLRGLTVLAIENVADRAISATLAGLGCTVAGTAEDVDTALDIIRRHDGEIDCAVLDIDLHGGIVYSLAAGLRARGVPLLFVARSTTMVADTWRWVPRVAKPLDDADLQAVLQATLDGSKSAPSLSSPALGQRSGSTPVGTIRYAWETAEESLAKRSAARLAVED